jgi:hypothetical protein
MLVNLMLVKSLEIPLTGISVGQSRIFAVGIWNNKNYSLIIIIVQPVLRQIDAVEMDLPK